MDFLKQLKETLNKEGIWENQLTLARNEHLKVQGSSDTNIYYVESGSLRVYVIDEFEEHTVRFGYSGSFITALDSYITGQPSDFYIQAIKKSEVKAVSKAAFQKFIEEDSERLKLWLKIVELLTFQQLERERDLLTSSPLARYQRVLARSPGVFQEIPHKYIASYLRMTPETFSRLKKS